MPNEANTTFNIGDIVFQVFSLLFIALIVTIVVIAIRMIRRKQVELKKVEARLNKVIEKSFKRVKIRELTGFFVFITIPCRCCIKRKRHLKGQVDHRTFVAA